MSDIKKDANFEDILRISEIFEFDKIAIFLIGVLLIYIFNKILSSFGKKISNYMPSKRLLILQIVTILIFSIYIFGVLGIFYQAFQPSKELMIALGGTIAVSLGLALKDIISSIFAGMILLFDKPFQVGDRITFNDEYGEIQSIGLRTVRMVTLDDNLVTIPNSRFLTDVVASGNSGEMDMMVVCEFYLSLDADFKKAKELIHEAIIISKYSYLKKPVIILLKEELVGSNIVLKITSKSYVFETKYEKALQSDIISKAEEWFLQNKIKRPNFSTILN